MAHAEDVDDTRERRLLDLAARGSFVRGLGAAFYWLAALAALGALSGAADSLGVDRHSVTVAWLLSGFVAALILAAIGAALRLAGDFVRAWAFEQP